jgi:HAD superfamily hydrolase (TIGR01662 family)
VSVAVVIPSAGRESLRRLVDALASGDGPQPDELIVVDDRDDSATEEPLLSRPPRPVVVLRGGGRGPAAARNLGWRHARSDWIAFLDDDVVPPRGWPAALAADLESLGDDVAASQGRVAVPLPADRRPTDWERNVAGLEHAQWATADMAYRRAVLDSVGGFDERFPRAYREDAELGLRVTGDGWRIVQGRRGVVHPVRPAGFWVSVKLQRGNADDAVMRWLHGRGWRERAGVPRGRLPRHVATVSAAVVAGGAVVAIGWRTAEGGRRWLADGGRRTGAVAATAWLAQTAQFAWARIARGPRSREEVVRMVATSVALPFAAVGWRLYGELQALRVRPAVRRPPTSAFRLPPSAVQAAAPAAVLFDRDGTLIVDVPYNGDPHRVHPMPGARAAIARLRAAGVAVGVVSNQSGVARGLISPDQVAAVNRRVDELIGPFDTWAVCQHGPADGCAWAARDLGVAAERCAVVGDIGADVEAARAAGARGVLVPTPVTRREEVAAAQAVAPDLVTAMDLLLRGEGAR